VGPLVDALVEALFKLPRPAKRLTLAAADVAAIWLGLLSTGALLGWPPYLEARWLFLLLPALTLPVFARLGLYRAVVRYVGAPPISPAVAGITISAVALLLAGCAVRPPSELVRTLLPYSLFAYAYLSLSRHLARVLWQRANRAERVAIFGTGEAAVGLLSALRCSERVKAVALLDDDPRRHGHVIAGVEVVAPDRLPELSERAGVRRVLLAMPEATRQRRREALLALEPHGVVVQIVPDIVESANGCISDRARDLDLDDLLGRDPVPPEPGLLEACIDGKSVLVTGAGGSIGSELCRQIARLGPSRLVLVEMSEAALYRIDQELRLLTAECAGKAPEIVSLLGDCRSPERMQGVMERFGVETVYHAAAYKHVPIVEENVVAGVCNNALATWHTANAAAEAGVETFVLVSTDKAVHPTSVMGASKRLAELALQAIDQRRSRTRFCMVRFGNVIASSGSVIPLFRSQVERGGPVTVTHPDVVRYFMTIPEAAHLVIQAGALAKGGDVFVLDMGEPVRIDDLARRVIQLMGRTVRDEDHPDGSIELRYTGLRPGEKLFEELLIGENVTSTKHPMIMRVVEPSLPLDRVAKLMTSLELAARRYDCPRVLALLREAVAEYEPGRWHDLVMVLSPSDDAVSPPSITLERRRLGRRLRELRPAPTLSSMP
jgi:FlaA1/EpsC-like NDP-sugar epimerase